MKNAVRVQVKRASPRTRARWVHRPVHTIKPYVYKYNVRAEARAQAVHAVELYAYKYSMRAQTRGPKHNRCISQAVHAKTLCKWYKHSTYVQAQSLMYTSHAAQAAHAIYCTAHAYAYSRRMIQRSGYTCQPRTYTHPHTRYTARAVQAEHRAARTHAETVAHKLQYEF